MKDYLPDYNRKKGEPRDLCKAQLIKNKLPKQTQKAINDFVNDISVTVGSESYKTTAENTMILFFDVIGKPLKKISKTDIQHFVRLVNDSNKTRTGRKHIFYMLRKFISTYSDKNFLEFIKNKRETGNGSRITKSDLITADELERMLRKADNLRDKALLTLLWESAARPDEILGLRWKDVIINDDGLAEISLFSGKKKETRHIIVKDCVLHLERWKAEYSYPNVRGDDFIFVGKERDKSLTSGTLLKMVKSLGVKAQIQKNIFPYLFRHTRLTFMRQKLKTPHYTQFAGHTERQATTYTHLDTEDLKEAVLKEIYPTKEVDPKSEKKLERVILNMNEEIFKLKADIDCLRNTPQIRKLLSK